NDFEGRPKRPSRRSGLSATPRSFLIWPESKIAQPIELVSFFIIHVSVCPLSDSVNTKFRRNFQTYVATAATVRREARTQNLHCVISGLEGGSMKLTRVLGGSVFAFLFGYAISGGVDFAQAQSICSCPAGSNSITGGRCQTTALFCA